MARDAPSRFTCTHPASPYPISLTTKSTTPAPVIIPQPCRFCSLHLAQTAISKIHHDQDPRISRLREQVANGKKILWKEWEEFTAKECERAKKVLGELVEKRDCEVKGVREAFERVWGAVGEGELR